MTAAPNPFNPSLGTSGLFANAGVPVLDDGVIPLGSNAQYLKVIDLVFLGAGAYLLWHGHSKKSSGLMAVGAILILAGITGAIVGWD